MEVKDPLTAPTTNERVQRALLEWNIPESIPNTLCFDYKSDVAKLKRDSGYGGSQLDLGHAKKRQSSRIPSSDISVTDNEQEYEIDDLLF